MSARPSVEPLMNTIIIGAGIAGLSAAWQLLELGARHVTVLEREALPFSHSSARNAAIFRPLEESACVVDVVARSRQLLEQLPNGSHLLRVCGLLLVAGDAAALAPQRATAELRGVVHQQLDEASLFTLYPELEGGRARHALWLPSAGVLDVHGLGEALRHRIGELGGTIRLNQRITRVVTDGVKVCGLSLESGPALTSERIVIAAGAWARELGLTCGLDLPLVPHRRHLAFLKPDSTSVIPPERPVVWDVETGVYFRPEQGGVLACPGDHEATLPGVPAVAAEQLERLAEQLPLLCPMLNGYSLQRPWACLRTMSSDSQLVIGPDPRVKGLHWVAGLGGQGMSAGLGAGEIASKTILGMALPPFANAFLPERLLSGREPSAFGEHRYDG